MADSIEAVYRGMPLELNARDVENSAYFGHCARGEFRLQRCEECNLVRYPPAPSCPWCSRSRSEWVPVRGCGTVYSYMEVHHAVQPAFRDATPFLILLVELDTQRDVPTPGEALRVMGNLVDQDGNIASASDSDVGIGSRVCMVFTPITDGIALPQWVADASAPGVGAWRYPE